MNLIIVPAILCLAAVPVKPSHHEIHKRMTSDQVLQVFGTTHEDVPEYEIVDVEVAHMQKRSTSSGRPVRIRSRNGNIKLLLEPTEGILATQNTPVTIGIGLIGDTMRYEDVPNIMQKVGSLWQDSLTGSSLFLSRTRNRRYALNGNIDSKHLVIRSLPEELDNFATAKHSNSHIVFKSNGTLFGSHNQSYHLNETMLQSRFTRNKREFPSIIYPEVLAVVDASSYAWLGSDLVNTVRYVLQLWNLVDLRYRNMQNPKVRINIARIVIVAQPQDPPYIWFSKVNENTVISKNVLKLAGQHFYSHNASIPITSYDVIMIMTRHHLIGPDSDKILGTSYASGACSVSHNFRIVDRVGIFIDNGAYDPLQPAQELGYLLGANVDEEPCSGNDGYIMSFKGLPRSRNAWKFSDCSVRDIQNFIQQDSASCLTNRPITEALIMPRFLSNSTLDEQCQILGASRACKQQNDLSSNTPFCRTFLTCLYLLKDNILNNCYKHFTNYPAEGTRCNEDGKICVQGECVTLYAE